MASNCDLTYSVPRRVQNSDATFFRRTIRTKPDLCVKTDGSSFVEKGFVPAGDMAVPDLGLAGVDPNQLLTQNPVDRHNPLWLATAYTSSWKARVSRVDGGEIALAELGAAREHTTWITLLLLP